MSSSPRSDFEKKRRCPSSAVLLSYQQHGLTRTPASPITDHLAACDFCSAELQLLTNYPATPESTESPLTPPIPDDLRILAEALLSQKRVGATNLLEMMFEPQANQGNIRCKDLSR